MFLGHNGLPEFFTKELNADSWWGVIWDAIDKKKKKKGRLNHNT